MGIWRGATWSVLAAWTMVNTPFTAQPISRKWAKNMARLWSISGSPMATVTTAIARVRALPRPHTSDSEPHSGPAATDSRPDMAISQPAVASSKPDSTT